MNIRYIFLLILCVTLIQCKEDDDSNITYTRYFITSEEAEIMNPASLYQRKLIRYFYDDQYRLVQSFLFHGNEKMAKTGRYWYNPGKKAVYYERTNYLGFGSSEELAYKIRIDYDMTGNPIRQEITDENGSVSLYLYEYNEMNRKAGEKYYRDSVFIYELTNYIYDGNGNNTFYERRETQDMANAYSLRMAAKEKDIIRYGQTYTYDSLNRISSCKKYIDGIFITAYRNYRYDENGNPVYYEIYNNKEECEQKVSQSWQKCEVNPYHIFYNYIP